MSETTSRVREEKVSEKRTSLEDLFVGKSQQSRGSRKIHEARMTFFQGHKKNSTKIK